MNIPIEIFNNIMIWYEHPTARIIRDSKFYGKAFPFLYLNKIVVIDVVCRKSYLKCLEYYQEDVYWKMVRHQHPIYKYYYILFHIHKNYNDDIKYSENTGIDLSLYYETFRNMLYRQFINTPPYIEIILSFFCMMIFIIMISCFLMMLK